MKESNPHPATQDAQQLFDLREANAHIRVYSVYSQWKELKAHYPDLKKDQHAKIIRQYINQKNEK